MLSKFIFCFLSVLCISTAKAEEKIVTLKKGELAPFEGTLFSTSAAARIAIELETKNEACQLKLNRELEKQAAFNQFKLDLKQASLDACLDKYTIVTDLKQQQLNELTDQLKKNSGPQPAWWFAGGIVGGVAVTVLSAWALSQASN